MKKIFLISIITVAVISIVALVGTAQNDTENLLIYHGKMFADAYGLNDSAAADSEVLATYGEREITAAMVAYKQELAVTTYSADGTIPTEKPDTKEVVDQLLMGMILVDEAERIGVAATPEEVQEFIAYEKSLVEEYPEAAEMLQAYMTGLGIREEEYWKILEKSTYCEFSVRNLKSVFLGEYEAEGVSEEEALAAYDTYKADLLVQHQEEITYYSDLKQ